MSPGRPVHAHGRVLLQVGDIVGILHHVTESLVPYSAVFSPEVVRYPLYFLACEVCQLTTAQGEATHKLVLSDDSTPQLVMVLEELRGANLILVNNVLDPSKYILNRGDRRVLWE